MDQITKTIDAQHTAIDRLTCLVEDQQQTITQLKEAIVKLTSTVANLEHLTTTLVHQSSNKTTSPVHAKAGKRLKIRTAETSPTHNSQILPDDPMEDTTPWEAPPPNLQNPDRGSPSPSM